MKEAICQGCGQPFQIKWAHNPNLYCSRSCVSKRPAEKRFWAKVQKTDLCWNWTGAKIVGYGAFWYEGKNTPAHRFAYELLVGPIPDGLDLDHLCRNRACVNPDHLEAVTEKENILRGFSPFAINARKTHCAQGHPFTPENTYQGKKGRSCIQCRRERVLAYKKRYPEKNRAAVRAYKKRKREQRKQERES